MNGGNEHERSDKGGTITIIVQFFPAVTNDFLFHIRLASLTGAPLTTFAPR